ncbi:MAG: SRPBCC family protein [Bdellovibrionales bacterium]|nr:SRPBCC family protein [Bdellovibrionales bacterium]
MLKKILLGLVVVTIAFMGYVATRESKFRYERSGVINAPAAKIFPYISNFKMGSLWSPYEKVDPNMKKNFVGPDAQVGSMMEFDGNMEAGSGKLEITKMVPNEMVEIRLIMTKPLYADNTIEYRLSPDGAGTRFTWAMSGDGGFMGKLMTLLIDCEKMVGDQFTQGIQSLKAVVEAEK